MQATENRKKKKTDGLSNKRRGAVLGTTYILSYVASAADALITSYMADDVGWMSLVVAVDWDDPSSCARLAS